MHWKWLPGLMAIGLASCGTESPESAGASGPLPPGAVPPRMAGGGTPLTQETGLVDQLKDNPGVVMNPDEIVFTDPDAEDPDAITTELKELLDAAPTEGPWRRSYTNALKEARQTGKPVLIWFTDSQNSPNCKALSEELFSQQEFEDWAQDHYVRLMFDQRVTGDKTENEPAAKAAFIKEMKKRYKVLGQPTLVVLTPAGEVIGKYRGYRRGEAEYKWGLLRQAELLAKKSHAAWLKTMEKKGYRMWSDPRGRKIFAKLVSYHKGDLILVEPDGNRAKTKEFRLSVEDQEWIAEQKRLRGIE
ncbi:thioredoxin-related protein [Haloferula luteola]|uniref:Thioredoxin-related protein n=1 Tax=Haloferula luteola TaxID=595692 RepID=A0A840V3V9_9BACT|nr:thioredoxin family protein [Haloferula luteola]MBB5352987.1 thioredoxin-related protein [Haloferula luteola]